MRSGHSAPIDVVVADPAHLSRAALASLLAGEEGLRVTGMADGIDSALALVRSTQADVAVITAALATPDVLARCADVGLRGRIVVLGDVRSPGAARAALLSGAAGYVSKLSSPETLVDALRAAAEDRRYLEPAVGAAVAQRRGTERAESQLTPREHDVLRLIALGHTNRDMATQLGVGVRTIEAHRSRLQRKLGISKRSDLVLYARDHGLTESATGAA